MAPALEGGRVEVKSEDLISQATGYGADLNHRLAAP